MSHYNLPDQVNWNVTYKYVYIRKIYQIYNRLAFNRCTEQPYLYLQNMIWKTNSNKANALFMVRSQTCQNGLVQLQDCIGELDNEVFCQRYFY